MLFALIAELFSGKGRSILILNRISLKSIKISIYICFKQTNEVKQNTGITQTDNVVYKQISSKMVKKTTF